MPVLPTYPGVYVEEIPSGVHTITGVATSIAAFVGRAPRGPVNAPVMVTSFAEFQRTFGGLDVNNPLTYAVYDFYLNGGSQAIIVRLYKQAKPQAPQPPADASNTTPAPADAGTTALAASDGTAGTATAQLSSGKTPLSLRAASPGNWGSALNVTVDYEGIQSAYADRYGLKSSDLFNLTVRDPVTRQSERITNVTVAATPDTPRRLDRVLAHTSRLARVATPTDPAAWAGLQRPAASELDERKSPKPLAFQGGADSAPLAAEDYLDSMFDALEKVDLFNLMCLPPDQPGGDTDPSVYQAAMKYCSDRRAMLIVDPPADWQPDKNPATWMDALTALQLSDETARNAALYFPRVVKSDPLREGQLDTYVPCGIVAGVMARTDTERGVWHAPAGINATVAGIRSLASPLNDADSGVLNPLGINCLRSFAVYGTVLWGARTMRGADLLADDYKYVPVRRLALFIEESLYRGLKWAVFEPNDEQLWGQIRLNVGAFMNGLFRQGAFQGRDPGSAYFVKCDKETTLQNDINLGVVNVVVGFAPLKPAEFVVLQLAQLAGQISV